MEVTRREFIKKGSQAAMGVSLIVGAVDIGLSTGVAVEEAEKPTVTHPSEGGKIMDELKFVTYCGLYCNLCSQRGRLPCQANVLKESMAKEGYEFWGKEIPGFNEFWKFLNNLCEPDKGCPGCRQGGGPSFCTIRKCARERNIDVCVFCEEYPCKRVLGIAKGYPTLIADGKRMKEVGIEKWIQEQEARAKTGFAYVDIRNYPYDVPAE